MNYLQKKEGYGIRRGISEGREREYLCIQFIQNKTLFIGRHSLTMLKIITAAAWISFGRKYERWKDSVWYAGGNVH